MKNTRTAEKLRLGCEIALSVFTVALAVVFISIIAQIYFSADSDGVMYSREIVWSRLQYAIAPVAVWLVLVVACFVISVLFPKASAKRPPSAAERVGRLRKRIPNKRRDTADGKYINAEHKQYATIELVRIIAYATASAFALGVAIYTIVYISDKSNFTSPKINPDIIKMLRNVLPLIAVGFLLFIGVIIYERATAKRQLGRITNLLVACKGMPISQSPLAARLDKIKALLVKNEKVSVWCVRAAVLVVAVVFIGLGVWDGGANDVLGKAVLLCTECIGLG